MKTLDISRECRCPARMERLHNSVMNYAWGSRSAIATLQGRAHPTEKPEAELWLGAHVMAPSRIGDVKGEALGDFVARQPVAALGPEVNAHFHQLPFLLKVLAAEAPLSLQAHPSAEQAALGFQRENALHIPLTAPHRIYKDANHKPELICALTDFEALCGFRPVEETRALFAELKVDALREKLALPEFAIAQTFQWLMRMELRDQHALIARVLSALDQLEPGSRWRPSQELAHRLHSRYPGDIGVVASLLLNHVTLRPGEALFLPAGNLHGYLRGTGVEIMASSDNVLRGGLTPKHVDVDQLISILHFDDSSVQILKPSAGSEHVYDTPVPEFSLSRCDVTGPMTLMRLGPDILLCTSGSVTVSAANQQTLKAGESVFVSHAEGLISLSGHGTVFRATVGR